MSLNSDAEHGVKSVLQRLYPNAFFQADSLGHVAHAPSLRACALNRNATSAGVDGNVLMMRTMAATLEQAVRSFECALHSVSSAARVVIVVFDEPELLTLAKREEQYKRDVRVSAEEAAQTPTDGDRYDDKTLARISAQGDLQALFRYRPARVRLFDEIVVRVACILSEDAAYNTCLYFDGVDPRGARRGADAEREPTFIRADRLYAIRKDVAAAEPEADEIELRHAPAGEGDIKLALVEQRLEKAGELVPRLHLTVTVDTDSIPISLVHRASRLLDPFYADTTRSVLCMRNTGTNASGYTCMDVAVLYSLLQTRLFAHPMGYVTCEMQRAAITLLAAGWALCGCDYVELKGVRATEVHSVLPSLLAEAGGDELLSRVGAVYNGAHTAEEVVVRVAPVLRSLVNLCYEKRCGEARVRKKTLHDMQHADDVVFKRAAWVAAYWNKVEYTDELERFGFAPYVPAVSPDLCGKRVARE